MQRHIAALLASALSLFGAVKGVVLDPSGAPILNARIDCAGRSTATGADGRFAIDGVDQCTASVSAAGFETRSFPLAEGAASAIELAVAGLTQRVVVSATRVETSVEEAGVSASVVTRSELEMREFPFVADVLREVPGVQVARYGRPGSLTQMFTRGAQRTGTLVLVDGVPISEPGGELNLAGLTSGALERMEVVRGPESALFGAEASAGVIQLFTRRGDPENRVPRGSVSYERGSFQTDRWIADLNGGSGARLDYAFNVEQYHTVGEFPNDLFRNTAGAGNIGFRLSDATQVRGVFRTYDSMMGVPNQVGYRITDLNANEETRASTFGLRVDDARGSRYVQRFAFGYHRYRDIYRDPGADGPFETAALVRDVTTPVPRVYLERVLDPARLPATIPAGTRIVTSTVDYLLYPSDPFLTLTSRKTFDYQGTLTQTGGAAVFGYEFERQGGDITGSDALRDNHGFFVHKQHVLAGRVFLSGGLRMEQNSVFHTKLTPRAAASIRVAPSTFVRVSAARGITEPTLVQNFARDPFYVGNTALRPEKTTSFDAGVMHEWLGRRLRTELSVFDNSFRDLIVFVFLPYPEPSTWRNVEASRARGLELSAEGRFARVVSVNGSYTYMRTRITSSTSPNSLFTGIGQELARRPGNSGAVSVSIAPRRWWFQAGAVFVGERQDNDLFGVTRNGGYQTVYAAASLRLDRRVTPFVRVNNLLNSRYYEVLGYPSLSRSIQGGLRLAW